MVVLIVIKPLTPTPELFTPWAFLHGLFSPLRSDFRDREHELQPEAKRPGIINCAHVYAFEPCMFRVSGLRFRVMPVAV